MERSDIRDRRSRISLTLNAGYIGDTREEPQGGIE